MALSREKTDYLRGVLSQKSLSELLRLADTYREAADYAEKMKGGSTFFAEVLPLIHVAIFDAQVKHPPR